MGNRQWFGNSKFLILLLLVLAIGIGILFLLSSVENGNTSPISPLAVEGEQLNYLDGEGEIEWYESFYVWNPKAQSVVYPFITGTTAIHWLDVDTGLQPVAKPITSPIVLVIELELRGTKTYTQKLEYDDLTGFTEPSEGIFYQPIWTWINIEPGTYDEYIKAYWLVGDERIPLQLVRDGQIIQPVTNFVEYRENLTIPELIYLPIVMRNAR